jgi:hypothetical protein
MDVAADGGAAIPTRCRRAFLAPEAIARAIARAIEEAGDVEANEGDPGAGRAGAPGKQQGTGFRYGTA